MPRITSVTASRRVKLDIGSRWESAEAFFSATAELEPGDDYRAVARDLRATVQSIIHEEEILIRSGDEQMPIKKLQSRRRAIYPTLGNIRKGGPKGSSKTKGWKGGDDLDYLRVEFDDPELQAAFNAIYGTEPKEIRCMLLHDDADDALHAWNEIYSGGSATRDGELTHRCDGETIVWPPEQRGQPCQGGCKPHARLHVYLYEIPRVGIMKVRTQSAHDIVHLTNQLTGIQAAAGQLDKIPLILRREEREITMNNPKGGSRREVRSMLSLEIDAARWQPGTPATDYEVDEETGEILDFPTGEEKEPAAANPLAWWGDEVPGKPEINGTERPWAATLTRQALRYNAYFKASKSGDKPVSEGKRGATLAALNTLMDGDAGRKALLMAVFGIDSSKALTDQQAQVLLDWSSGEHARKEAENLTPDLWWDKETKDATAPDDDDIPF